MLRENTKVLSFAVKRESFGSKDVSTQELCKKLVPAGGAGQEAMGGSGSAIQSGQF